MSHHLDSDLHYLRALARSPVPYVGLLGPAARREKLLGDLGADAAALRGRLRAPVGLDIGGRTPESIALSIVGEVHAALAGRGRPTRSAEVQRLEARSLLNSLPLVAILAVSGLVAGFAAGLLGVGGGIVTVPVLEYSLRFAGRARGIPHARRGGDFARGHHSRPPSARRARTMRAAPSTGSSPGAGPRPCWSPPSPAACWRRARRWPCWPASSAASRCSSRSRCCCRSITCAPAQQVPRGVGGAALAALIGGVSAVMGIGGGTLTVPTLNLCGYPIHRAVGTASFFGIVISIPGTVGYLLAQPPVALPWATVGFVSLVGLAIIAPGSMLTATLGARVAHYLEPPAPVAGLRRVPAAGRVADALSRAGLSLPAAQTSASSKTTSIGNAAAPGNRRPGRRRAAGPPAARSGGRPPRSRAPCLRRTNACRWDGSARPRPARLSSAAGVISVSGYGAHFCGGNMPMRPAR